MESSRKSGVKTEEKAIYSRQREKRESLQIYEGGAILAT